MTKVGRNYHKTLQGYLRWLPEGERLFRPDLLWLDETASTAAEIMLAWESEGKAFPAACSDPTLLADYVQAKTSRDWHISEWRLGIAEGLFTWREFVGTFGLTEEECRKLLGNVKIIWPCRVCRMRPCVCPTQITEIDVTDLVLGPPIHFLPGRQLSFKPPFSKQCACGLIFTDETPIYCYGCRTFTHTVYWLKASVSLRP